MSSKQKSEVHVGCSPLTNAIYAGRINRARSEWVSKQDVTGQACGAVVEHVLNNKGPVTVTLNGVPTYEISVRVLVAPTEADPPAAHEANAG